MPYHPVTKQITDLLDENNMWYETFEHEPVRTSEEAAETRPGYTLSQGAKAIITRVKIPNAGKKFVMLVMPADQKFDSTKVKDYFKAKDLRFAMENEVERITSGVMPGGVPPFGNLFDLLVVADTSLFENEKIVFNAGDRSFSVAVNSEDYKKLVQPIVRSIC